MHIQGIPRQDLHAAVIDEDFGISACAIELLVRSVPDALFAVKLSAIGD